MKDQVENTKIGLLLCTTCSPISHKLKIKIEKKDKATRKLNY